MGYYEEIMRVSEENELEDLLGKITTMIEEELQINKLHDLVIYKGDPMKHVTEDGLHATGGLASGKHFMGEHMYTVVYVHLSTLGYIVAQHLADTKGTTLKDVQAGGHREADLATVFAMRAIRTLAHELRHAWQYENWSAAYMDECDTMPYKDNPMEVDANAYADQFIAKIKETRVEEEEEVAYA